MKLREYLDLPAHSLGGLDPADVYTSSVRIFVAHTANGSVEVIEGERARHLATVSGCPEDICVLRS